MFLTLFLFIKFHKKEEKEFTLTNVYTRNTPIKSFICLPVCIRLNTKYSKIPNWSWLLTVILFVCAGITDIQVDKEKSKIVVVGKVEDRSVVLKKVKKIFKGAKFVTKEETKNKDPDDDSGTSGAESTTTTKDQFVQYYAPALPPMSTYYYHPDQLWPYSYPTPPYNYPLITYRPWMNLHTHLFSSIEFASILAYWPISLSMAQN